VEQNQPIGKRRQREPAVSGDEDGDRDERGSDFEPPREAVLGRDARENEEDDPEGQKHRRLTSRSTFFHHQTIADLI
jgi:hypothetical protein